MTTRVQDTEGNLDSIGVFINRADLYFAKYANDDIRKGQAYANFLSAYCGDAGMELYGMVTGTVRDPFSSDALIPAFLSWLAEYTG